MSRTGLGLAAAMAACIARATAASVVCWWLAKYVVVIMFVFVSSVVGKFL